MVVGLVGALLVATTTAFVATEALKLKRPPVGEMRGDRAFAPGCGCPRRLARVTIRLREDDALEASIVDASGQTVRVLREDFRPGRGRVALRWNGRNDERQLVGDGAYRLRVHLDEADRTVTFSRRILVDTQPPTVRLLGLEPTTVGAVEEIELRFELSEQARAFVRVDGRRAGRLGLLRRGLREAGWPGTIRGQQLEPGVHRLALVARDRAGNRSEQSQTLSFTVSSEAR